MSPLTQTEKNRKYIKTTPVHQIEREGKTMREREKGRESVVADTV